MRNTRNASKSTPPAKKTAKATPSKGTPKTPVPEERVETVKAEALPIGAEKKEDPVNAEADLLVVPDAPVSSVQADVKPEGVDALVVEAVAGMVEAAKEAEGFTPKASPPQQKADDTLEKGGDLMEASKPVEAAEESRLTPTEQADSASVQVTLTETIEVIVIATTQAGPSIAESSHGVQASKAVDEQEMPHKAGDGEEMQEGGQGQVGDVGMHDAEDECNEDDDEEGNKGEEEDIVEDEGEEDFGEERPASDRQKRKKLEVFVGGLDKEATAEEVKKTFEAVGEVVEVRLTTHPHSGKNRGYAFVRFATVDQASRAASELDRIKIRDKECAVVPSEDNDTLFVGNLCKSWASEKVLEKLKEYGVDGIDEMVLAEDPENEGHSKGHAFLEFVTHTDALKAFKRLSKPDAIFGCDRSARVAWADGSSEPDEMAMAKVKSVFVDNMPVQWDEQKIKEQFSKYGVIERLVLAKNIPRSKRRDFAFVNFATRDAAVAAIEALNDTELADGAKGVKLKVELAKPTVRKKRIRGHRGSYPVGDRPSKQKQKQKQGGDRNDRRKNDGGHGGRGNLQRNSRGEKRRSAEETPVREQRPQDKHARGSKFPKAGASVPSGNRGGRVGLSSRRGGSGAHSDEDYLPMGVRMTSGFAASRDFSGRPPREPAYSRMAEMDHAYPGVGSKRAYPVVDEEAAYYGSAQRGYPRARLEYADPSLGGVPLYPEPLRAAPLGHSSLSHSLPAVRGGYGYTTAVPGAADYNNGYGPTDVDPRGASYYGGRSGSGYSLPSGSHPYY